MKQGYIFLGVLAGSLLLLALALFFPSEQTAPPRQIQNLPWQIETTTDGSIRVFGLQLERSSINDAIQRFDENAEVSMFVSPTNKRVIEVYFNNTRLAGLNAKVVLSVAMKKAEIDAIYNHGTRISTLGDGSHKVTLSHDDLLQVKESPIAMITYLPKTKLNADLLLARFGEPARRIRETKSKTIHWLYPSRGLDIAQDQNGRTVIQYLPPREFEKVMQPLLKQGKEEF
ncbi:hypothetical protein MNBD_GAMMA24-2554 [hydrothermal vent metagenome]|uniref:Uncharacterized protein n=1 Tax=hydrothermal vent metagenome TaxID=652676 RepID=A0A3B1BLU4_9ZZZZ